MKRIVGMSLFGVGIALGALARQGADGFLPWPVVLGGHALLAAVLGLVMMFTGSGVPLGTRLDWRMRVIGIGLAVVMTVLWRAVVGAAYAAQMPALGWLVSLLATALLLFPAVFCWGYVFATFIPAWMRRPAPAEQSPVTI